MRVSCKRYMKTMAGVYRADTLIRRCLSFEVLARLGAHFCFECLGLYKQLIKAVFSGCRFETLGIYPIQAGNPLQ